MTPIKRPLAASGAAVLLALSLSACGGGDSPTDASKGDFCDALANAAVTMTEVEGDEPTEDEWEGIQQAWEDLGDVGTPEDISEENREGFEVTVEAITDLDYEEAQENFGEAGGDGIPGVSEEDDEKADKFFEWAGGECEAEIQEQIS